MKSTQTCIAALILLLSAASVANSTIPASAITANQLTITSFDQNGNVINGMWTTIQQNGNTITSGYTPFTTSLQAGTYTVTAADYEQYTFSHWQNDQTTSAITVNVDSAMNLAAYYNNGQVPAIQITYPSKLSSIVASSTIITVAGATADSNGIRTVELSVDGGSYFEAQSISEWAAWASSINFETFGLHTINARATNNLGNTATDSITITINGTSPIVKIVSEENNSTINMGSFTVKGTASGSDLANVTVSIDGGAFASAVGTSNWSYSTSALSDGTHTIVAVAEDNAGNTGTSEISYETGLPTISILSPIPNAQLSTTEPIIVGSATGDSLANVTISIDGGTFTLASGTTSWSFSVPALPSGNHAITAKVTDGSGKTAFASSEFTIQNDNRYDNFPASYSLSGGQTSPNGKWYNHYTGYGSAGVKVDYADSSNLVFAEQPEASTTPGITHAALTTSVPSYHNYKLSLDMRTDKQLRTGSSPNNWENAWIMFNYADDWHHYYFTLKNSGAELGKKDNDQRLEQQVFLATTTSVSVKHGQWQHIDITIVDNRITAYVDGVQVASIVDSGQSLRLAGGGHIGLYTEDAGVSFDNISVSPLQ